MKKLVIVALSAVLAVMAVEPAHAQDQKVLAIIDTAIDSQLPEFKDKVIYEACFTLSLSMACPNGQRFMEGAGSANSKVWPANIRNGIYHGQNMTRAALAINPNIKIIFVRISDITAQGNSTNQPEPLISAIEWVSKNAEKYSIDAVSISQAGVRTDVKTRVKSLHPACSDTTTINSVSRLKNINVPIFAATGNDRVKFVGFPACIADVVGVGALAAFPKTPTVYNNFAGDTNIGPGLDIVAPGDVAPRVNSTSGATVFTASSYLKSSHTTLSGFVSSLVNVLGYPYVSK
jgi:hypothetical protein